MNFSLLEILILLLIIYPFIKSALDGMKGEKEEAPGGQRPRPEDGGPDPWNAPEEYSWGEPTTTEQAGRSSAGGSGSAEPPSAWDEMADDLEHILTGERSTRPSDEPVQGPSHSPSRSGTSASTQSQTRSTGNTGGERRETARDPAMDNMAERWEELKKSGRQESDVSEDLVRSENPIYKDLDEAIEVSSLEGPEAYEHLDVTKKVLQTDRLRDAWLMKEILDRPLSRRRPGGR